MNQIIFYMKNEDNSNNNFLYKKKKFYFSLLFFFIFLVIISSSIFIFSHFINDDKYSQKLIENYNISKLYNTPSANLINTSTKFSMLGMIEIPKLNISYPILSKCTDENLKIAPCKFSGPNIGEIGNFSIIGHNYNNSLFFSNINRLKENDEILLYDLDGNLFAYSVSSIFEVTNDNLTPTYSTNSMELTLITCNNFNSNKIIVKSILKK